MHISGTHNLFSSSAQTTTRRNGVNLNIKSFLAALEERYATPEAQRAADMTAAIEAFDGKEQTEGPALLQVPYIKSLLSDTQTQESEFKLQISLARAVARLNDKFQTETPVLSDAQLTWLRNRYTLGEMAIICHTVRELNPDGSITGFGGGYSLSEAHNNLLDDLHGLGMLSDRDMEILNAGFSRPQILPDEVRSSITKIDENLPFYQLFFRENINPFWTSDIAGYHRAMADNDLETFLTLERKNIDVNNSAGSGIIWGIRSGAAFTGIAAPPNNEWFIESAEVRNRLANILEQII